MSLGCRHLRIIGLAIFLMGATANGVYANAEGKKTENDSSENADSNVEEIVGPFSVTRPVARNPFPPEIMEKMRKELKIVMGIKDEEPKDDKKKEHKAPSH